MEEDDDAIGALAQAVLDGEPIDWPIAESAHRERSRLIGHLRFVDALARAGRDSFEDPPKDSPAVQASHWGDLRVVERIGGGAFGEVYRAWDARLEREVALKLLPTHASGGDAATILREGRLLARVRHPNVVTIHGADLLGEHAGLWMELVRGRTLEALLQDGETFTPSDVARIGVDLARALHAVHDAGLLHRDVKAQNVMREDNGRIVLMDFGTGLRFDEQHGSVAGTPLYLAPEVFRGQPASRQSDVYSLGALLFHLLTRSFPVQAGTLPALARVVARAIDPRPEARYPNAAAMAADLETAAVRQRRWPWLGAAAAVALVLLGWFAPERPIVGVLPFDVPGSDAGDHVLAEGLAIDLRRRLAQFHSLTVRPARVRRGTPTDLQALGRQLGANHVLIGSVIGETGSMFAKGDQGAVNPGTTAFLREGDLLDSATYYRHDLAWLANPAIPKNPHLFVGQPTSPDATVRAISLGAQEQLAVFFESYGQTIIHPMPAQFFETPIAGAMPETLAFIR